MYAFTHPALAQTSDYEREREGVVGSWGERGRITKMIN